MYMSAPPRNWLVLVRNTPELGSEHCCALINRTPQSRRKRMSLVVALWLFFSTLAPQVQAETGRWKDVVGKIRHREGALQKSGTGWCLNPQCDLVVTNYHVVRLVGPDMQINGVRVSESHPATGDTDEGARWIRLKVGLRLKYNPVRDIAILRMHRALAQKGMHGIDIHSGQLQPGQEVTLYAYPGGKDLAGAPGKFVREMPDGMLLFGMQAADAARLLQGGSSGGLIVDRQQRAVGLLWGIASHRAFAVPMWSVADFVKKVEPELYATLFPGGLYRPDSTKSTDVEANSELAGQDIENTAGGITPEAALPQSYLRYGFGETLPPLKVRSSLSLVTRSEEPVEVQNLRSQAQAMLEHMKNFIALQTLHLSGGRRAEVWQHEVRVVYGQQTFRKFPDGKEEFSELPYPKPGVIPGGEWADLLRIVGTDLKLTIEHATDLVVEGKRLKVFRYQALAETGACSLRARASYGLWHKDWESTVACRGEAWTDEHNDILRITQDLEIPSGKTFIRRFQIAVMYGWLEQPGLRRELLPVDIFVQGKVANGQTYSCSGQFTNYRVFVVNTKLDAKLE